VVTAVVSSSAVSSSLEDVARDERSYRDRCPTIPQSLWPSAINIRIASCRLYMTDVYLRSIDPLIAIILGCMRRRGSHKLRR
jgi:hypothetical protein